MAGGVRDYAIERWGLAADASTEDFGALLKRQVSRGVITRDRLLEIHAGYKAETAAEAEADVRAIFEKAGLPSEKIDAYFAKSKLAAPAVLLPTDAAIPTPQSTDNQINDHTKEPSMATPNTDQSALVAKTFGGAAQPNVKSPSARYSAKRFEAKHAKTGQPVFRGNSPVELPSDREHALIGAWLRGLAVRSCQGIRPLDDHEHDLIAELANDHLWCGDVGGQYHTGTKLATALGRKGTDFIADATSGGSSLVPYFFDTDIVTFPLLSGELAPMVDMRDLGTSNQVITPSMQNVTASWQGLPSEGSGASVSLQSTDGLCAKLTQDVFDIVMAVTLGRNMMSDSSIAVGREVTARMGERLTAELDKVISIGNGTSQPKGLSQTSGTNTVNAVNNTTGPLTVADVENLISSLPKQYRQKNDPSVAFVMNDANWFRIRGIPVSSTDQRRIFGYDYEQYTLASRPVKICNDIQSNDLFFGKLSLYRMNRRQGLNMEMSTQGKTLMLNNEILVTGRGRYSGMFMNGAGLSFMANAK